VFGGDPDLVRHDAPAVQHLGARPLQLLQDLRQLRVVVAGRTPTQDPGQVVPSPQREDPQLALGAQGGQPSTCE